jgi:hypothetical protein
VYLRKLDIDVQNLHALLQMGVWEDAPNVHHDADAAHPTKLDTDIQESFKLILRNLLAGDGEATLPSQGKNTKISPGHSCSGFTLKSSPGLPC